MYEHEANAVQEDEDVWFNRILTNIDRILKVLTQQIIAIDSLERKINQIMSKRY